MSASIRRRAFAKINLGLKIVGRRPDGYHEIRTIFQTINLHDTLQISLARNRKTITLDCDDPSIPVGRGNLVVRACELWRKDRGFKGGISVRLLKRIPAGSGLGGASSDAAATLLGLERLAGNRLPLGRRMQLAAELGSDVPFFLVGGRALGIGRGEEVYPLPDLTRRSCLIVFPGFTVSTAVAYREAGRALRAELTKSPKASNMLKFGAWPHLPHQAWGPAENDFERVVFARWPELARLKRQLFRAGAESASLTGSGSAVFGLFVSARHLSRAKKFIPRSWKTYRTRTLSRPEYLRAVTSDA